MSIQTSATVLWPELSSACGFASAKTNERAASGSGIGPVAVCSVNVTAPSAAGGFGARRLVWGAGAGTGPDKSRPKRVEEAAVWGSESKQTLAASL